MKTEGYDPTAATAWTSPLLQKARSLGLGTSEGLRRLAVGRGCGHDDVTPDEDRVREVPGIPPSSESFNNAELAVALLSLCPPVDLLCQRMGAALLGSPEVDVDELARLAVQEQCAPLVKQIAVCGKAVEPDNAFWERLGALLAGHSDDIHAMPHPTRFMEMTGMTRGRVGIQKHWIRPRPLSIPAA